MALKIEFNDRYSQASTCHPLGRVMPEQEQLQEAVDSYFQAVEIYAAYPGDYNQTIALGSLARVWGGSRYPACG